MKIVVFFITMIIFMTWVVLIQRKLKRISQLLKERRRHAQWFAGKWPTQHQGDEAGTHGTLVKDPRTGEYRVQKRDRV